jgi:glycosyltransferase involved in cell wall biosynthesis
MHRSAQQSGLRVIYDVSVLGLEYERSASQNGVFRVVEELGKALIASNCCTLEFSATASAEIHHQSWEYLRHSPAFKDIPFRHPHLKYLVQALLDHRVSNSSGASKLGWKAARKVVRRVARFGKAANSIEPSSLALADVFHSQFHSIPPEVRKIPRIRSFLTVYDLIGIFHPEYYGLKSSEEFFLKGIIADIRTDDWVVSISQKTKDDLCNYRKDIDPNRVFVTPLAASDLFSPCMDPIIINKARAKYRIPEGPYLLSLCTLEPRKNLPHLIRCFRDLVSQENTDGLRVVLVGSLGWNYEGIFVELEKTGPAMRDRIVVTGRVHNDDLTAIYSGAVAFVYPSLYEGFGLPPLEAMKCGVPVITSNTTSLPEVVGDAGLMVDPRDGSALCQAMLDVSRDRNLRERLSTASIKRAALFSWQRCATETVSAYRTAASSAGQVNRE